ncbi:hypothetical protein Poli38472_006085 [Pythium oligandrum]|uniref:Eukaryotic translation initiation factor 4E n=1 Tax=Pythium oligandrum TaxID=41045 RepID=A0A8K1CRQ5_PYTOL|nr:hypothetical protein Poli38472_006085 [Pythium oligandrum]|eukprot:TMW68617.1 hypothetical protein Poli38472_006085 [Pythium oligandrum]
MGEEKRSGWKEAAEGKPNNGETPIQNAYSFSYIKRNSGNKAEVESYEKSIKELGDFKTVQGFWQIYNHLVRPNDLPNTLDYHLFKTGIKPMWEDPANRKGGKWMVRVRKGISSRYWEDLVLAIVGEQFDVGNEICGAVVSIRYTEDVISLWNRNADNSEACYRIRDTMRKVLNLPQFVALEYRRHDTSLGDNSGTTTRNNNNNNNNNNSSVWRDQRSGGDGNNASDSKRASGTSGSQPERSHPRFTRERSDRSDRGDRGDREGRGDRTASSGNSRSSWGRDSKRPIFTKTGSESGEGAPTSTSSNTTRGDSKKASSSSTPNAWQQK